MTPQDMRYALDCLGCLDQIDMLAVTVLASFCMCMPNDICLCFKLVFSSVCVFLLITADYVYTSFVHSRSTEDCSNQNLFGK